MKKFEDVRERVFLFSLNVIKMCNDLPRTESNKIILRQLICSSTSIGANLEEAVGAYTKNDFIYGMNISRKEARETHYWLKLLYQSNKKDNLINALVNESDEILRILTTSVKRAKLT